MMFAGQLVQMCNVSAQLLLHFDKLHKSGARLQLLRAGAEGDSSLWLLSRPLFSHDCSQQHEEQSAARSVAAEQINAPGRGPPSPPLPPPLGETCL